MKRSHPQTEYVVSRLRRLVGRQAVPDVVSADPVGRGILHVPEQILLQIMSGIPFRERVRASRTSKMFSNVLNQPRAFSDVKVLKPSLVTPLRFAKIVNSSDSREAIARRLSGSVTAIEIRDMIHSYINDEERPDVSWNDIPAARLSLRNLFSFLLDFKNLECLKIQSDYPDIDFVQFNEAVTCKLRIAELHVCALGFAELGWLLNSLDCIIDNTALRSFTVKSLTFDKPFQSWELTRFPALERLTVFSQLAVTPNTLPITLKLLDCGLSQQSNMSETKLHNLEKLVITARYGNPMEHPITCDILATMVDASRSTLTYVDIGTTLEGNQSSFLASLAGLRLTHLSLYGVDFLSNSSFIRNLADHSGSTLEWLELRDIILPCAESNEDMLLGLSRFEKLRSLVLKATQRQGVVQVHKLQSSVYNFVRSRSHSFPRLYFKYGLPRNFTINNADLRTLGYSNNVEVVLMK